MSKYRGREINFFKIPNGSMVISFNRWGAESEGCLPGSPRPDIPTTEPSGLRIEVLRLRVTSENQSPLNPKPLTRKKPPCNHVTGNRFLRWYQSLLEDCSGGELWTDIRSVPC